MTTGHKLRIEGRVQGVSYRAWAVETARTLRLSGWVRNRRDGSVEALVIGEAKAVESFVGLCHRGPPAARVTKVAESVAEVEAVKGFRCLPTE